MLKRLVCSQVRSAHHCSIESAHVRVIASRRIFDRLHSYPMVDLHASGGVCHLDLFQIVLLFPTSSFHLPLCSHCAAMPRHHTCLSHLQYLQHHSFNQLRVQKIPRLLLSATSITVALSSPSSALLHQSTESRIVGVFCCPSTAV